MNLRKAACAFLASLLMLCGCAGKKVSESGTAAEESGQIEETSLPQETPEPTAREKAEELLASMSLEDKAGQLVNMAVRTWNGESFTAMNDEVRQMFARYHFGGICLFAENITYDNAMTAQLTQDFQLAVTESGGVPMLVSADQEGGSIYRLVSGTATPGNMALAATGDPGNAYKAAEIIGSELSALGFNTDFAPVADVNSNPANPVIGVRAFSDDPFMVSLYTQAYVQGLQERGIVPGLKHFPGHGDTASDSHTGLPLIEKTKQELEDSDLIPFEKMIRHGYADLIMTAHIQFPSIEKAVYTSRYDGNEINLPATLSKTILTDIVRNELGFEGVIITDAMLMDALAVHFDPMDAASLALNAGADMLLMPVNVNGTDSIAEMDAYMEGLIGMINDGTVPLARVDEAVLRILTLKYERGIMDAEYSAQKTEQLKEEADHIVASQEHQNTQIAISDEAATVLENNGVLPLAAQPGMRFLLSGMNTGQTNMLAHAYNLLESEGYIPADAEVSVIDGSWAEGYPQIYESLEDTDVLILTDSMYSADLIDTYNYGLIPAVTDLIRTAHEYGVSVIVISCALPYDLPLLREADALLAVYNQTGLPDCDDAFNPLGAYGPNLAGAMDVIFGKVSPKGKLPVDIPAIEDGTFTDQNTYSRGDGLTW